MTATAINDERNQQGLAVAAWPLAWCREGWYVDIEHAGPGGVIVTRYCHMLVHPAVDEGQHVIAGQVIGISGSSGHSSGPHLHYEVHLGDHSPAAAVDPVPFMARVCAPLGQTGSTVGSQRDVPFSNEMTTVCPMGHFVENRSALSCLTPPLPASH
jgi:hypothetical protein